MKKVLLTYLASVWAFTASSQSFEFEFVKPILDQYNDYNASDSTNVSEANEEMVENYFITHLENSISKGKTNDFLIYSGIFSDTLKPFDKVLFEQKLVDTLFHNSFDSEGELISQEEVVERYEVKNLMVELNVLYGYSIKEEKWMAKLRSVNYYKEAEMMGDVIAIPVVLLKAELPEPEEGMKETMWASDFFNQLDYAYEARVRFPGDGGCWIHTSTIKMIAPNLVSGSGYFTLDDMENTSLLNEAHASVTYTEAVTDTAYVELYDMDENVVGIDTITELRSSEILQEIISVKISLNHLKVEDFAMVGFAFRTDMEMQNFRFYRFE